MNRLFFNEDNSHESKNKNDLNLDKRNRLSVSILDQPIRHVYKGD